MKKILLVTMLICITFCSVSCGKNKEINKCLDDLKLGLQERWDISDDYDSLDDIKNVYLKSVDCELNYLEKYKDTNFEDKAFQKLIKEYINGLESQKQGCEKYFYNNKMFDKFYYREGYDVRSECLNKFIEDYNFSVDKEYSETLKDVIDRKDKQKRISTGEIVNLSSDYGEISIQIDGFEIKQNEYLWEDIDKDQQVGILKYIIKNKSFEDPYNGYCINISDAIQVYDENYYVLDPDNTSGDYKEYNAGGNYPEVGEGQKKKLNTQYIVNKRDNKILITIGENSSIILDIE